MPVRARRSVVLPWSMWPAVPTTTVIARSARARSTRRGEVGVLRRRRRCAGRARPGPSSIRPMTIGVARRGARARTGVAEPAPAAPGRPTAGSRRAASRPPTVERERRRPGRVAEPRRERHRPAARGRRAASASIRQTGISVVARPARYSPSVAATPAIVTLSGSHRPGERVAPEPRDEVGATDDEPGLRPADELVAAERHEVGAGRQALAGHRLVGQPERRRVEQGAAAQVVDDDRAVAMGELGDRGRVGRLGEAGHREVRGVDPQDDPRAPVGERRLEVRGARPVRRPDLDEPRAGAADDLGDAHAAADLDELAARHDDAATAPGEPDRQRHGRRVVVGDERVLGAGQGDEVVLGDPGSRAATAGRPVELEEQVAVGRGRGRLDRRPRGQGARPRFVWTMTPVALMTGWRRRRPSRRPSRRADGLGRELVGGRARSRHRREPLALVGDDVAGDRGQRRRLASTSRRGRAQRGQDALDARRSRPARSPVAVDRSGPPWRERVGVEPTTPHRVRRHRC